MAPRMRQRKLFEFVDTPPVQQPKQLQGRGLSPEADSEDDLEGIQFEREASDINKKSQSSPVTYVDSTKSSSEGEQTPRRKRPTRSLQSQRRVVVSDGSESQQPRKRRRLIKGKRPGSTPTATESDDSDLLQEVDKDMILHSRLRDRSKKSAFALNLERLRRRRRGHVSCETSEEEASNSSELSYKESPPKSELIRGAHPSIAISDDDASVGDNTLDDEDENDFIVEDDGEEAVPALPTMFSMDTYQDLSHHFKVICQLFVHLAVKKPPRRHSFMKELLKKNYFSVPLAITRRKISGIKDSLVTSSVWKPALKHPLETLPAFRLETMEFAIPLCDACHLGKRVATLRGIVSGYEYDPLTYEPRDTTQETGGEEPNAVIWNLGRFCAARAQIFHSFSHWEYKHYHSILVEVDRLRSINNGEGGTGKRVFMPATSGPPPPDDLDDADGVMDWLDGRGIIDAEWIKMKAMMERANKLEAGGRVGDDMLEE